MRVIDLSATISPSPENTPEFLRTEVNYHSHADGAAQVESLLRVPANLFRNSEGWSTETISRLGTHDSTHVDAPWHYSPTSEGKRSRTIDEMPLEWFYGDGVVLDMRHKPGGSVITIDDLKEALERIGYKLKPGNIVLIQTGVDKYWGKAEYFDAGCGMSNNSTLWLINHDIRVMGIDAWGWDRPFWAIKEEFLKTKDRSVLWGAHFAGIEKEYCHIEKLANLDKLPAPFGFKVACFPVKLTGGSAGWCRVVAILEE